MKDCYGNEYTHSIKEIGSKDVYVGFNVSTDADGNVSYDNTNAWGQWKTYILLPSQVEYVKKIGE